MTVATGQAAVTDVFGGCLPIYRRQAPPYRTMMLDCLRALWRSPSKRLFDIGGGARVIGDGSGWRIAAVDQARYRHGQAAWAFPNRLETMMRWERV